MEVFFCINSYLPPLKEDTISSQGERFHPSQARRFLLKGKTFIFISKKQVGTQIKLTSKGMFVLKQATHDVLYFNLGCSLYKIYFKLI